MLRTLIIFLLVMPLCTAAQKISLGLTGGIDLNEKYGSLGHQTTLRIQANFSSMQAGTAIHSNLVKSKYDPAYFSPYVYCNKAWKLTNLEFYVGGLAGTSRVLNKKDADRYKPTYYLGLQGGAVVNFTKHVGMMAELVYKKPARLTAEKDEYSILPVPRVETTYTQLNFCFGLRYSFVGVKK